MKDTTPPLLVPRLLWGCEESNSLYKVPFHTFGTAKRRYLRLKPYESNPGDRWSTSPSWVDVALIDDPTLNFSAQNHCIVKASSPLAFVWNDPKLSFASSPSPLKKLAAAATTRDRNSIDRELLLDDIIQFIDGKRTAAFKAFVAKNGNSTVPHESQCFSLITLQRSFDFFVRKNDVGGNTAMRSGEDDAKLATSWKSAIRMLLDNVCILRRNGLEAPQQQQRMLSLPAKTYRDAMFEAAKSQDIGTLRWYFESGCPVDLMDAASGDTVLIIACRLGHLDVARLAVTEYHAKNDPHPDFGQTALQVAVSAGHKCIVQMILESMEHSHADRIVTNHADENGEPPLHVAARCGSIEIMELLILHGANLGLVNGLGKTCLHYASQFGHASCLALALDYGADEYLEMLSHDGYTPLHLAVRSNKAECVKLLLESGADVSAETASGQSVYGLASQQRNGKILALLDEYDDLSDEDSFSDRFGKNNNGQNAENIFQGWKKCAVSPTNLKCTQLSIEGLVSPEKLSPSYPCLDNREASFARSAPVHTAFAISPIVGTNLDFPYDGQPQHSIFESRHWVPSYHREDHYPHDYPSDGGQFYHGNETWIIYFSVDGYPYFYNINQNWSTWNDPRKSSEQKANVPRATPLLHKHENGTRSASDESLRSPPIPPFSHIFSPNAAQPCSPAVPLNLITKIAVENCDLASEGPRETVLGEENASDEISSTTLGTRFPLSAKPRLDNDFRQLINTPNKEDGSETVVENSKSLELHSSTKVFHSSIGIDADSKSMVLVSPMKMRVEQVKSCSTGSNVNAEETYQKKASNVVTTTSKGSTSAVDNWKDPSPISALLVETERDYRSIKASQQLTVSSKGEDPKNILLAQIKSHSFGSRGPSLSTASGNPTPAFNSNMDNHANTDSKGILFAQTGSVTKLPCTSVQAEQSPASSTREKRNETSTTPPHKTAIDSCLRDLSATSEAKEIIEDPDMAKYFKTKAVGIPMEAVLHKMKQNGTETEKVNSSHSSEVTAITANVTSMVNETTDSMRSSKRQSQEQLKESLMQDETLKKFMRMASVGVPPQAVAQKMKQEGVDESKIDSFNKFHGLISSTSALPPPPPNDQPSEDLTEKVTEASSPVETRYNDHLKHILMQDETVKKFMRMASVGVPVQAVARKMHQEGVDKSKIDSFNEFHGLSGANSGFPKPTPQKSQHPKNDKFVTSKEDIAKDDTFSKYLKMKDVGVPIAAVVTKMAQDGIDGEKIHLFSVVFGLKTTSMSSSPNLSPKKLSPKPPMIRERRRASKALQKIHWTAVAEEKLQNSLWASESIEIDDSDIERFESLFSASTIEKDRVGQKTAMRKISTIKKKSSVIDPKRANNIAIALAQFRAFPTFNDLCQAVASLDRTNLNTEHLANLQLLLPTPEELNMLEGLDGQSDGLGRAELFFLSVMRVPRFSQKLAAFKYLLQFDEQVHSLTSSIKLLAKACIEVIESQKLAGILRRLLAIGNLMNESCGKPHARGITLDSLLKTAIKKGSDGKTMVIDLLVSTAMSSKLDIVDFWTDMPTVRDAMRFDLDEFRLMLREIQNGLQSVDRTVESEKTLVPSQVGYPSEQFLTNLIPFLERAQGELGRIKISFSDVEDKVQLLCSFFAEESKSCKASTIFGVLMEFSRLIEKSKERHIRKEKQLKRSERTTVK